MITMKPHHFVDIIKLYGAGIEHFVPDEKFRHDFYKAANEVIGNPDALLKFTVCGDDICRPCNRFDGSRCTDSLEGISGYCEKETYNRMLDQRLFDLMKLNQEEEYSVRQALEMLGSQEDVIFKVWLEENDMLTEKRSDLFWKGLNKLITEIEV